MSANNNSEDASIVPSDNAGQPETSTLPEDLRYVAKAYGGFTTGPMLLRAADYIEHCHLTHASDVDEIEGLSSELRMAVETAYERGATEWTRMNYPKWFDEFQKMEKK